MHTPRYVDVRPITVVHIRSRQALLSPDADRARFALRRAGRRPTASPWLRGLGLAERGADYLMSDPPQLGSARGTTSTVTITGTAYRCPAE